jgi:hypothetical protein
MMDMKSRNQYLEELIRKNGGYHLGSKKQKSKLLDEYCQTTGQNRKYVIRKLRRGLWVYQERRKKSGQQRARKCFYDNSVVAALIKCFKIFDYPCGERLAALLRDELDRLIAQKELICSDETAKKLKMISPRTIDEKLAPYKEKENIRRSYDYKNNPLLYQKIPTKLSADWDKERAGNIQIDFVEHCGAGNFGQFVHTLSATDIATGWWEGGAQIGKSEKASSINMKQIKDRFPFPWKEIHPDNDSAFINWQLWNYAKKNKIKLSRSRPYHKNDNCWIEQKNSSHVRRTLGHYRYDTKQELKLINDTYADLRIYKNFFQPITKLISKERIGGHIKRKYEKAKTPYRRVIEDKSISETYKNNLRGIYASQNPAALKRNIDEKIKLLKQIYDAKQNKSKVKNAKELNLNTVTFLNCATDPFLVT